ncbi:hypothetical protein J4439_03320 [Candidatus Woesearchaeota archaeon]|nr:hypothetical protein [Candidatus Woesearchaeota archaeon]
MGRGYYRRPRITVQAKRIASVLGIAALAGGCALALSGSRSLEELATETETAILSASEEETRGAGTSLARLAESAYSRMPDELQPATLRTIILGSPEMTRLDAARSAYLSLPPEARPPLLHEELGTLDVQQRTAFVTAELAALPAESREGAALLLMEQLSPGARRAVLGNYLGDAASGLYHEALDALRSLFGGE